MRAGRPHQDLITACSAAVDELRASRAMIDTLEKENAALSDRLATEQHASQILTELNATRTAESRALSTALAAKDETIAAKDDAIKSQQRLIDELKRKRPSPWRRLGDILLGAGAIAILK